MQHQLTFSTNCVSLQISGQVHSGWLEFCGFAWYPILKMLCDCPLYWWMNTIGLIASISKGSNNSNIKLVKNLLISYISKPSCLILSTIICESIYTWQQTYNWWTFSDKFITTIPSVCRCPHQVPLWEEDHWLHFIWNKYETLENGWMVLSSSWVSYCRVFHG
jgi:hypothetical protein